MENFSPISAFIGGALIGVAASVLLLFNGKILGVSGIIAQVFSKSTAKISQVTWNILFLAGIISGTVLYQILSKDSLLISIEASIPVLIVSGFLVGVGTNLGSGCTSGHGVCGIARLSARSIVATTTFMASGMLTVFIVRHMAGG